MNNSILLFINLVVPRLSLDCTLLFVASSREVGIARSYKVKSHLKHQRKMCSRNLDNKTGELLAMVVGGTNARKIERSMGFFFFSVPIGSGP